MLFPQNATSSGIFIAFHEGQKQISNPSLNNSKFSSLKVKTSDTAWHVQHREARPHVLMVLNKLCAHLSKYNGQKWSMMIAVTDRLKLLECHQKASDCSDISDLWSNTSQEQLLLSAHIPVWLLLCSRNGTFLSRGWRDWKNTWSAERISAGCTILTNSLQS